MPKRPLKVSLSPQMTVSPYPENTLPKQALRICEWSISYRFGRQIPHLTLQKRKVGQLLKWATAGVGSFCLEVLTSYFSNINVTGACWLNKQLISKRVVNLLVLPEIPLQYTPCICCSLVLQMDMVSLMKLYFLVLQRSVHKNQETRVVYFHIGSWLQGLKNLGLSKSDECPQN